MSRTTEGTKIHTMPNGAKYVMRDGQFCPINSGQMPPPAHPLTPHLPPWHAPDGLTAKIAARQAFGAMPDATALEAWEARNAAIEARKEAERRRDALGQAEAVYAHVRTPTALDMMAGRADDSGVADNPHFPPDGESEGAYSCPEWVDRCMKAMERDSGIIAQGIVVIMAVAALCYIAWIAVFK